jgi:hypothetical protein
MTQTNSFTPWHGIRPQQAGDIVIIEMGETDDFYARIVRIEGNKCWFEITDKNGVKDQDANSDDEMWVHTWHISPYADPIPNRYIISFAPIAPLPFEEPVDPRDA